METHFENYQFQVENAQGDVYTFDWDEYPVDLVGIVVDEIEDSMLATGDLTEIIAMSLCPSVSTAIRYSKAATSVLPEVAEEDAVPITVKLVGRDARVVFSETLLTWREGDEVGVQRPPRSTSIEAALERVKETFPDAEQLNEQFVMLPDSDRAVLMMGILAATKAVVDQLGIGTDIDG